MNIYAIVNEKGFISAFVNADVVPEILKNRNAIPAPSITAVLEEGKTWKRVHDEWVQVRDPNPHP